MSHFTDVRDFHKKFNLLVSKEPVHLTQRKLKERIECMQEELNEFAEACGFDPETLEVVKPQVLLYHQADALVDLVYFTLGTAVMMGLPWKKLWKDVQRANMAKVRGVSHRGHAVDCVKPEGWVPPQGFDILADAGYIGFNGESTALDDASDQ